MITITKLLAKLSCGAAVAMLIVFPKVSYGAVDSNRAPGNATGGDNSQIDPASGVPMRLVCNPCAVTGVRG